MKRTSKPFYIPNIVNETLSRAVGEYNNDPDNPYEIIIRLLMDFRQKGKA